jgi:HD-like signal output (HDOD) protein
MERNESPLDALPSVPLLLARVPREGGDAPRLPEAERLVLADQALAAMVLRVANSPLYGRPGGIVSLDAAVRHLGAAVVRRIAAGMTVATEPSSDGGLDRPRFVEHFLAAAAASRALARRVGGIPPDDAYAAGLLHSLGQAVFAWRSARKYGEVLRRSASEGKALCDLEKELLGNDHG